MTRPGSDGARDAIIEGFLREGFDAAPEKVARWVARHPEHRGDIVALAATLPAAAPPEPDPDSLAAELATFRREAVARVAALAAAEDRPASLRDLLRQAGIDLPELARRMGFRRGLLSEVEQGHVKTPLVPQFVERVARALRRSAEVAGDALAVSATGPVAMHAKADGAADIRQVSWRELIEGSDLPEAEKAYWLDGA